MGYSYDKSKLKIMIESGAWKKTHLATSLGMKNVITINRWMDGGDVQISKLLNMCNAYNTSIGEFILKDGIPIDAIPTKAEEAIFTDNSQTSLILKYEREISDVKLECQQKVFDSEHSKTKEISAIELRLKDEYLDKIDSYRKELHKETELEKESIKTFYNEKISDKEKEIEILRRQIEELQLSHK